MPKFKIPVEWSMSSSIEIDADTFEDAVRTARENLNNFSLPEDGEYIPDSFSILGDCPENDVDDLIEELNWAESYKKNDMSLNPKDF